MPADNETSTAAPSLRERFDHDEPDLPAGKAPQASEMRFDRDTAVVVHPPHYGGDTTYEAIKVIDAWGLGFALGNVLKYICRANRKDNLVQNLKKARWYLDHEIERLEAGMTIAEVIERVEQNNEHKNRN